MRHPGRNLQAVRRQSGMHHHPVSRWNPAPFSTTNLRRSLRRLHTDSGRSLGRSRSLPAGIRSELLNPFDRASKHTPTRVERIPTPPPLSRTPHTLGTLPHVVRVGEQPASRRLPANFRPTPNPIPIPHNPNFHPPQARAVHHATPLVRSLRVTSTNNPNFHPPQIRPCLLRNNWKFEDATEECQR